MAAPEVRVIGLTGLPEVRAGAGLAELIVAAARSGPGLEPSDVVVVTQKIVSKAEGRVVALDGVTPSPEAEALARETDKEPRLVELVLRESARIVRQREGVLITETRHGFVCANAGIDASNVGEGYVSLLPEDPDRSAAAIRSGIATRTGVEVAVIISDTFGRPWREGQTNVAVGVAGMAPFADYVGQVDAHGYELKVSSLAVADELAGAAELVMGKLAGVPVAIVRGYDYPKGAGTARQMVRPAERDLFR
ncbi:MAG TPA: coenzyme F420-0:L-glutamate ligase [Dehalococcoidia bacterium]|nr:coenzyme F420-0:L-glutamate ligase [Dehalococcoidia bacterium]